jgi:hypothetical protein
MIRKCFRQRQPLTRNVTGRVRRLISGPSPCYPKSAEFSATAPMHNGSVQRSRKTCATRSDASSAKGEARRGSRSRRRLRRACQESTLLIEPPKLFPGDPDAHDILRGICPGQPNAVSAPKLRAGSPKVKTILLILDIRGGRRISAFSRWRYYNMHAGEIEWRMRSHQTDISGCADVLPLQPVALPVEVAPSACTNGCTRKVDPAVVCGMILRTT